MMSLVGKNFKSDTKKLSYNPKRDSENSNIEGSSKKKKKKAGINSEVVIHMYTEICRCDR